MLFDRGIPERLTQAPYELPWIDSAVKLVYDDHHESCTAHVIARTDNAKEWPVFSLDPSNRLGLPIHLHIPVGRYWLCDRASLHGRTDMRRGRQGAIRAPLTRILRA